MINGPNFLQQLFYLEHKHFSPEDGDGVKVPIADVGAEVRLVR